MQSEVIELPYYSHQQILAQLYQLEHQRLSRCARCQPIRCSQGCIFDWAPIQVYYFRVIGCTKSIFRVF